MRKHFALLIMFLGLCPMLMAQNIQGVVTDTKGKPISFANVVELLQSDSSFVKGTVSKEDGSFMLEGVKSGNVIRVSLIGYETQYIIYGANYRHLKTSGKHQHAWRGCCQKFVAKDRAAR